MRDTARVTSAPALSGQQRTEHDQAAWCTDATDPNIIRRSDGTGAAPRSDGRPGRKYTRAIAVRRRVGEERARVRHGRAQRLWRFAGVALGAVALVLVVEKTPVTPDGARPDAHATGNAGSRDRSADIAHATAVPAALSGHAPSEPLRGTPFTGFMPQ